METYHTTAAWSCCFCFRSLWVICIKILWFFLSISALSVRITSYWSTTVSLSSFRYLHFIVVLYSIKNASVLPFGIMKHVCVDAIFTNPIHKNTSTKYWANPFFPGCLSATSSQESHHPGSSYAELPEAFLTSSPGTALLLPPYRLLQVTWEPVF